MKALRVILIILIVLFAAYCVWMFTLPKNYKVSRSEIVDTSPEQVYNYVSDFKNWPEWLPWYENDSTMVANFGEQTQGVGASYNWSSENSGSGEQEITEADPPNSMKTHIKFKGTFDSESDGFWKIEEENNGKTRITWGFEGEMPFLMRSMGYFMEDQVGPSFEQGLDNIREKLEEMPAGNAVNKVMEKEVEPLNIYSQTVEIAIEDLDSDMYAKHYGHIANYLDQDMQNVQGPPLAIFHEWNEEEGTTEVEFALNVQSEKPGNDTISNGMTYSGPTVMMRFQGPYEKTGEGHDAIMDYINNNNMTIAGAPYEVYVSDPAEVENENDLITEIYVPVQRL